MKIINYHLFIFFAFCGIFSAKAQYIQVDDSYTPQQLVENVLVNSTCATVSNISVLGGNFGDGSQSYGYFNGNSSGFPFTEGIILSSGRATSAVGPNNSLLDDGGGMNWPGDRDLEEALEINNSVNATLLEFDFVPLGNKISFRYMLSSEEYHDNAPCRYSDGFAFLLREAGTTVNQNLAVVPGTNIPVKVTSVRPQIDGAGGCEARNEAYFGGFNGVNHPTNFNGQTVPMIAEAEVIPGTLYHIKLVIADEGNYRYDSAIFLDGGSFTVETDLGNDRLVASNNPLCQDETLLLDATSAFATNYDWYVDGVLQSVHTPDFLVENPGTYTVEVTLSAGCVSTGNIEIEYAANPTGINSTLIQCDADNDGFAAFNLAFADSLIVGSDPDIMVQNYYYSAIDAQNGTTPIPNPDNFTNTQNIVYARILNNYGCVGVAELTLDVSNNTLTNPANIEECDVDSNPLDGFYVFDLTENEAAILANFPAGSVHYFTSEENALLNQSEIISPENFVNTNAFSQTIYAKLRNGSDCFGIVSFEIIVNSFGESLNDVTRIICSGSPITLNAGAGFGSYTWNTTPPQNTQTITVNSPGTYTVTVTNANNCEGTKTFTVTGSSIATVQNVEINDFSGGNNSATIILTPDSIGDYVYSLNGSPFQTSPTFDDLPSGEYTVFIADQNFCGTSSHTFFVMDYPKFFTPNGDGYNDIWRIPYLQSQPNATVNIFDRYGKLLFSFKGNQPGWDGTFHGKNVFSNDYWFVITLENGRTIKGHFSLIR